MQPSFKVNQITKHFNLGDASVRIHIMILWDNKLSLDKPTSVNEILKDEYFMLLNEEGVPVRHDVDFTGFYSDVETVLSEYGLSVLRSDVYGMATVRLHPQTTFMPTAICAELPTVGETKRVPDYLGTYLSSILIDGWRVGVGIEVERQLEEHMQVQTLLPTVQYTTQATRLLSDMVDRLDLDTVADQMALHQMVYSSPALTRTDNDRNAVVVMRGDDVVGSLAHYTSLGMARVVTLLSMSDMVKNKYEYIVYAPKQGYLPN